MGTALIIIGILAAFGLAWQLAGAHDERERHRERMSRYHWQAVARRHRLEEAEHRAEMHLRREEVALGNNPDAGGWPKDQYPEP